MALVYFGECYVNIKTLVDFISFLRWSKYDAYGQNVVDLIEGDMLGLHLVPDGIGTFHALDDAVLEPHFVECLLDGGDEIGKEFITLACCLGQLRFYTGIFLGMFKAEVEILQFGFYFI